MQCMTSVRKPWGAWPCETPAKYEYRGRLLCLKHTPKEARVSQNLIKNKEKATGHRFVD